MEKKETILAAGGTGFIGSHTVVELLEQGYGVVIVDNLYNSSADMTERINKITGKTPKFYDADVTDAGALRKIFSENDITAVMHFAGYKAVGESVQKPLEYYRNNLDTTLTLLEVMREYGVKNIIFSSSATVYGMDNVSPMNETMKLGECTNPYGWTKWMIERIMTDAAAADPELSVVLLRYFNPIGAHTSGLIGERPTGTPNNLMPYISQVASGRLEKLSIYGDDYPTPDGTGVRDYIHVMDLAKGHVAALDYLVSHKGTEVFNLGTGRGFSVKELVEAFVRVNGVKVPYVVTGRRAGDIAECYADVSKAERVLGWKAEKGIDDMCRDSWRWEQNLAAESQSAGRAGK